MRDPERINRIVPMVWELWKKYPDLRLAQVFDLIKSYNEGPMDSYYVEDNEWETLLKMNVGVRTTA